MVIVSPAAKKCICRHSQFIKLLFPTYQQIQNTITRIIVHINRYSTQLQELYKFQFQQITHKITYVINIPGFQNVIWIHQNIECLMSVTMRLMMMNKDTE